MSKLKILIPLVIILIIPVKGSEIQECGICHPDVAEKFVKSLHHTNRGIIEGWNQGAGKDLNIPIPKKCLSCHIENCSTCHRVHKTFPNMSVCIECHSKRIGVNYIGYTAGMKEKMNPDIHYKHNMTCFDCHDIGEIHGDGRSYISADLAVKVRCEDCHMNPNTIVKGMRPKQYDPTVLAHSIHKDRISCYGCHAGWYQTCVNCHVENLKVDSKTTDEFHLIKGPDGKLYPACRMFVFYGDKSSYVWCLIHPHTIMEGKRCEECHNKEEEVFGAVGRVVPPGSSFAEPPSSLVVRVPKVGIKIDTEILVGIIIGGTLIGICIHYIKRKVTVGGE